MKSNFEEVEGGFFTFSEAAIRLGLYKCTWMALTTVSYGGFSFWTIFLLFQICPPCRLSLNILKAIPSGDLGPSFKHSLLLGSELGVLAMVAFLTVLVPALIMTWITALVFEYLFGRILFGQDRKGLIQHGCLIAKDMTWLALKSVLMRGNVGAVVVLIFSVVLSGFMAES